MPENGINQFEWACVLVLVQIIHDFVLSFCESIYILCDCGIRTTHQEDIGGNKRQLLKLIVDILVLSWLNLFLISY